MAQTRDQLGLTDELAKVPIHVDEEIWTLLETARYLYKARRRDTDKPRLALELSAELARLRREAQDVGDPELVGAADALEKSARSLWTETA